jgi:glycosyltransferase involved in cell wall biosynthesis
MNIAFEAKRAYTNGTGLGHYSRTLIRSLAEYYPDNNYFLFTPKLTNRFNAEAFQNVHAVTPMKFPSTILKSAWRSNWVKNELKEFDIDLYHGLSHEIPLGIQKTGIKTVVTIHDLIFERHQEQFNWIDVRIYHQKFSYACKHADKVIAISKQTKDDIIQFYKTPESKIEICYQSCNPAFGEGVSVEEKLRIKKIYNLPDEFLLYVGSIIERKNLLLICKGLNLIKDKFNIPLIVIGEGGDYKKLLHQYIKENHLEKQIRFLSDELPIKSLASFQSAIDFPAIYQQALCMIYPSTFEGFGIPVLEALWSKIPVITSNVSCLPETGGDAAYYVDPINEQTMAEAILQVTRNEELRRTMIDKGWVHAQNFTQQKCAASVLNVYKSLF